MLNQIAENKAQDAAMSDHSEIIKRYEMNYQKLKQISSKLGANIDFSEMENLMKLVKQNKAVCTFQLLVALQSLELERM